MNKREITNTLYRFLQVGKDGMDREIRFIKEEDISRVADDLRELFLEVSTKAKPEETPMGTHTMDRVTLDVLDVTFRIAGIYLDREKVDKIIDLVELVVDKGADASIKDVTQLEQRWAEIR